MHQFLPYAWFQGRCVPFEDAKVSVAAHALHYGTGAFGGMRAILIKKARRDAAIPSRSACPAPVAAPVC